MTTPIFSQAAIYRLQQLASAVHRQTGARHRLSDSDSLLTLLRYGHRTADEHIIGHYQAFMDLLTAEQLQTLERQGLPAGAGQSNRSFSRKAG